MAPAHVLAVYDICSMICEALGDLDLKTLKNFAIVSKATKDPALDALYYHVTLQDFLRCLPQILLIVKDTPIMTFSRSMTENDYATLDRYRDRVRILYVAALPEVDIRISDELINHSPTSLFPKLRIFDVEEDARLPPPLYRQILCPTLMDISWFLHDEIGNGVIDYLPQLCPHLQRLTILSHEKCKGMRQPVLVGPGMMLSAPRSFFVRSPLDSTDASLPFRLAHIGPLMPGLKTLNVRAPSVSVRPNTMMEAIARFQGLDRCVAVKSWPLTCVGVGETPRKTSEHSFPNLKALAAGGGNSEDLFRLLQCLQPSVFPNLVIFVADLSPEVYPNHGLKGDVLEAISECLPTETLRTLKLWEVWRGAPSGNMMDEAAFRTLFRFSHLTVLHFQLEQEIDMDDNLLGDLCLALSHLESLRIQRCVAWKPTTRRVTLNGLAQCVSRLLALKELALTVDTRTEVNVELETLPPNHIRPNPTITVLNLALSPLDDPPFTFHQLRVLFPNLRDLVPAKKDNMWLTCDELTRDLWVRVSLMLGGE
ncbi:hypothetical protein CONPUDRAFT_147918 [Coniophora puteana RWD-64-598 SS2]|uniref:F-box domain-containing protein n=1 Tax=Coniophora puteana (strain RWD-64-598) TaxID=741705 RepID=R7SDB8_CONPW|nr:uncharacterized protein CONPUDRAFT_147918 [Coniophora puteana RWD-64-598 SS2]EIW74158.1 hypothetical protein CONPUDRAFT_147918 [Coniophora puteana RWD-64-598 SS2]